MNRSRLLVAAVAVVIAGAGWAAPPVASSSADVPQRSHAMKLDVNHDGVIDRSEAANAPQFAAKFDALDKNHDGRLDAGERPAWKGRRGDGSGRARGGMIHEGMGRVVKLDTDGDGRISRVEAAAQPTLAARFAQADGNRDGYLVRSELRASAEKHRGERTAKRRERFEAKFTAADSNRDGKLSRFEVEAGMPRLAKAFAFHDEDRDGFLTRADLQGKPRR